MKETIKNQEDVGHDEIANLAREIWEREGRQSGRDMEYWLRAERQLVSSRSRSRHPAAVAASASAAQSQGAVRTGKGPASSPRVIHI